MSKFRGSITLSIFSLSTLSNYHYWQSPKTRYWRLARPYQTGIPPARLLALVWAHNSDLSICTQQFLRMVSSVFCPELRRQSQPQQFLSTSLSFSFDLIWLIFSYTSSILNFSYHRFLSPLEPCHQSSFSPMISNLSIPT